MRPVKPLFLTRWVLQPHRERGPRVQCVNCAGGGEINGVPCIRCGSRGWTDSASPPRAGRDAEDYAY